MIKLFWGKTLPTPSLFNINGKRHGKQTTQPLIPKEAPVSLRSLALYWWCLGFNGLEKTSSTKFYNDLDLVKQARRGLTQHWQVCLDFSDTKESLWASEWKSWTFETSSTVGNTQHAADLVREPKQIPPFQLRCEWNSVIVCCHLQGEACSWFGKYLSILITSN